MAQSILIFDFGTNEEAAQQARHKIEGWKQAFRLGDKIKLKFERKEFAENAGGAADSAPPAATAKEAKPNAKKTAPKSASKPAKEPAKEGKAERAGTVRLFVRLAFSDHEKLSHQRWLDRIPAEEPFKSAKSETVRAGDAAFAKTSETFDSLD